MPADTHAARVILWDSLEEPPPDAEVLLWEAFAPADGAGRGRIVSLSERVERDAESLRPRLLGFIAAVGRHRVDGRSVDEHLELREGLSAWRMTPFHSRPYTTRGRLHHAARLMVLESLLADRRGATLEVRTASRGLARACAGIAHHHGLRAVHSRPPRGLRGPGLGGTARRRLKDAMPAAALAALAVCDHLRAARTLHRHTQPRGAAKNSAAGDTSRGAAGVTVVDYWFRFGTHEGDAFSSQYWTRLVDALRARPARTSWLHLLVDDRSGTALRGVATRLATMRAAEPREDHAVLDGHGGWATVRGALADYLRLRRRAAPVARAATAFAIPGTEASLWPLFAADWRHGLRGGEAMQACLRLRALEHFVAALPRQRLGVYLMENQPWEMAFVHAWRRAGHGTLVGVAHSTVRWWDLRFLADATQYAPGRLAMPRPDRVAINGALARRALERAGHPQDELVDVEALMYLDARRTDTDRDAPTARGPLRLLVATDFMPEATARQLGLLAEALPRLGARVQVTVKPHWRAHLPALPAGVRLADGSADLATLIAEADALYVSTITSASLDAVLAGLRVVQCLDPGSFDLSPLRGDARVATVRSGGELAEALERLAADPRPARDASGADADALLHLDPSIPRWRSLLDGAPA